MSEPIEGKEPAFNIDLYTLSGKPVSATVLEAVVKDSEEDDVRTLTCILRLELPFAMLQAALKDEYFHLFEELISETQMPDFDQGKPVELELRLRKELLIWFEQQVGSIFMLPGVLRAAESNREVIRPLLQTESWLATTVTQKLELPPEIGDEAFANIGFRTAWAQQKRGSEGAKKLSLEEVATHHLQAVGLKVESLGDGILRTEVTRGDRSWVLLVLADEEARTLAIWSVYPQLIPAEQRGTVGAFLLEVNYETAVGGFEMDPDDGEIRFRTALDVADARVIENLFARLLHHNVGGMLRVAPLLDAYMG